MANYYTFYDPRDNNKVRGQSTDKDAMQFPYVKGDEW